MIFGRRVLVRRDSLRTRTFVLIACFSAALSLGIHALDLTTRYEFDSIDARFDVRGAREEPASVAVVGIDDVTFSDLQEQWPFSRSLHAKVIDRLTKDGARVIAYDVQFTEPSDDPEADQELIDATAASGRVVLVTDETDDEGGTNVFGGDEVVASANARVGASGYNSDEKAKIRTMPFRAGGLPSLSVATVERATGKRVSASRFTEPDRTAWIDFTGPPRSVKSVSFSQVYRGQFAPGTFRGRIVVVGAVAPTLQDVHPTSTTSGTAQMAGPEIQASAIDTLLRGLPLQSLPGWAKVLVIVLMAVAVPVLAVYVRFGVVLGAAVALFVGFFGLSLAVFDAGVVMPFAVPLAALVVATLFSTAGHALMSAAERQRTRDVFARFVPEAVVDDVLAQTGEDLRLGGQRREGTVLFCDLRGFTSFAEGLEPDRVIDVLNIYLSEMSDAIMEREGTIVAFMGDGIMAVFGAPLAREDHADRAVEAARDMLTVRLPRFNDWLFKHGYEHGFRMGIGLNSGTVMSGNVGSSTRMEYTAIGDTTNTAARIEGMTKDEQLQLLLSAATRDALTDDALRAGLRRVAERAVRGREEPITLFTFTDA